MKLLSLLSNMMEYTEFLAKLLGYCIFKKSISKRQVWWQRKFCHGWKQDRRRPKRTEIMRGRKEGLRNGEMSLKVNCN
jgi:hypothetical protein